jgi:hypothetical protein
MATIKLRIQAEGATGTVEMTDSWPWGARWREITVGDKFIGHDHRGPYRMGTYANAGRMFLEETNRNEDSRDLYPTMGVLVLNDFTYPRTAVGQHGSGNLQDSSRFSCRQWYVVWEVTAVV